MSQSLCMNPSVDRYDDFSKYMAQFHMMIVKYLSSGPDPRVLVGIHRVVIRLLERYGGVIAFEESVRRIEKMCHLNFETVKPARDEIERNISWVVRHVLQLKYVMTYRPYRDNASYDIFSYEGGEEDFATWE